MRTAGLLIAVTAALTASCGPPRARPTPDVDRGATGPDAGEVPQPASCAATFAATPLGQLCADADATCGYPEGRCWCGPRSYCGGAAPPPEVLAALARPAWQCQAFRTDGCPEEQPSGTCTEEGKVCSYGDCCFWQLTCQRGAWVNTGGGCPP